MFPSDPGRLDDGRTVIAFGMIRPYKGLGDAIEAVRRAGQARLLVAGEPREPIEPYRMSAAGGIETEWRLGYLSPWRRASQGARGRDRRDLPVQAELDQSGALLQALGAGVPAIAYDVGGIAEPIRHYGAGRGAPAGDVAALALAVRELLSDPAPLAQARAGAQRAREELTWDASAAAHLALYEEITSDSAATLPRRHRAPARPLRRGRGRPPRGRLEEMKRPGTTPRSATSREQARNGDDVDEAIDAVKDALADMRDRFGRDAR